MHNPAPVLENETHKLLWGIQTDHLISARLDLIIINKKKNLQNCEFCCPGWRQNITERFWKEGWIPQPCEGIEKKNYGTWGCQLFQSWLVLLVQ